MLCLREAEKLLSDTSSVELARVWSAKAVVYERKGEYAKAIDLQTQALEVFEKMDAKKDIADANYRIGVAYFYSRSPKEALAKFITALKIYEEINELSMQANVHNGIGAVYAMMGDYAKAMENYQKALAIAEK